MKQRYEYDVVPLSGRDRFAVHDLLNHYAERGYRVVGLLGDAAIVEREFDPIEVT